MLLSGPTPHGRQSGEHLTFQCFFETCCKVRHLGMSQWMAFPCLCRDACRAGSGCGENEKRKRIAAHLLFSNSFYLHSRVRMANKQLRYKKQSKPSCQLWHRLDPTWTQKRKLRCKFTITKKIVSPKLTRVPKSGAGAGVGVGMLSGRGFPQMKTKSFPSFKVVWFLDLFASWLFGFKLSKLRSLKVSKIQTFI